MGQVNSTQQSESGGLTNAQLSDNIVNMFKSHNTAKLDTVGFARSVASLKDTSHVEVDTIVDNLKGGNKSMVSAIPNRRRYKYDTDVPTNNEDNALVSDDINFVRDMIYNRNKHLGGENKDAPTYDDYAEDGEVTNTNPSIFLPTVNEHEHNNQSLSSPSDRLVKDNDANGFSATSPQLLTDNNNSQFSATSIDDPEPETMYLPSPQLQSPTLESNLVGGVSNKNTIDGEIQMIRNYLDNTARQHGGDDTLNATNSIRTIAHNPNPTTGPVAPIPGPVVPGPVVPGPVVPGPVVPIAPVVPVPGPVAPVAPVVPVPGPVAPVATQPDSMPNKQVDVLSEDGLAEIRKSLTKYGALQQNQSIPHMGGSTTNHQFDTDLKSFRDTILSQDNQPMNDGYSATSPDPKNYLNMLKGGAKDEKDEKEEEDEEEEDDEDEEEEDEEDDEQMGGKNSEDDSSSDSSESGSESESGSGSGSSSSSSDSEINDADIVFIQKNIDRTMDRRNNNSKYLMNNNYRITSNSDRDYRINNKFNYSSQTSDVHSSSVGSEYLNGMRNRDRSM
jgi:hypothetical protein